MAKFNKNDVLKIIINSANLYKNNLLNKNFLIISKNKNEPFQYWEVKFEKKQFLHLTGINTKLSANHFFSKATTGKLSLNDFEIRKAGTTDLKLSVLPILMDFANSVRIIGDYFENDSPKLYTEVLAGNVQGALGFVHDEKSILVPNTCLNCNIRLRANSSRIVLMLSKPLNEKEYLKLEYIAKDNFKIEDLKYWDSPFKTSFDYIFDNVYNYVATDLS